MSIDVPPPVISGVTPEEYLAREVLAETRSEYVNGKIIPMTGASERHCLIAMNLSYQLRKAIGNEHFRTYLNDLKTRTENGSYRYPDLVVLQPPPKFQVGRKDIIANPLVIFEILSPATEANDRGEKFADYRSIESLQAYILVSQDKPSIECFSRQSDDSWKLLAVTKGDFSIPPLDCSINLSDVYQHVEFEE